MTREREYEQFPPGLYLLAQFGSALFLIHDSVTVQMFWDYSDYPVPRKPYGKKKMNRHQALSKCDDAEMSASFTVSPIYIEVGGGVGNHKIDLT